MANTSYLGGLTAYITGDRRYSDTVRVDLDHDTNKVTVTVSETGAVGGMDGPGGTYDPAIAFSEVCDADPKQVLALVKRVVGNERWNFKRYGKPSKKFHWVGCEPGLSVDRVKQAIKNVTEG